MTSRCHAGNVSSNMSSRFAARLAVTIATIAMLVGVCSPPAKSSVPGRYSVEACTEAVGYQNHLWTVSINDNRLETHTTCGEPPAGYQTTAISNLEIADVTGLSEEIPAGAEGSWKVVAPEGETIAEATGYSSLYRTGGNGWQIYRETEAPNGAITIEQTCNEPYVESCGLGGPFQATALHARALILGARCEREEYEPGKFLTSCPDGALRHDVRAGIDYATITLEDLTPPSQVIASHIPEGIQRGAITIDASATDTTAGLLSLSVTNDSGQTIAGPISPGACNYSTFTPCPTSANLSIPINTETLPDGENQLHLTATNAAHDEASSETFTIDIDNHPASKEPQGAGGSSQSTSASNSNNPQSEGKTQLIEHKGGTGEQAHSQRKPGQTPLPNLTIHRLKVKLRQDSLTISGNTPTDAHGQLQITTQLATRHDDLTKQVPILHGRFLLQIRLKHKGTIPRRITILIAYIGSGRYRATTLRRTLRLASHGSAKGGQSLSGRPLRTPTS